MPITLIAALDRLAAAKGYKPAHEILLAARLRAYWWLSL